MNTSELIEKGVQKAGSDRKLAQVIGVSAPAVNHFKSGERPLPAYRAALIAKFIGENEVAAAFQALSERADGEEREFWLSAQKKSLLSLIAAVLLGISLVLTVEPAYASSKECGIYNVLRKQFSGARRKLFLFCESLWREQAFLRRKEQRAAS